MPNLVGTGLNQVPSNSMLGGMAYQNPDRVKIKKLNVDEISQINSEIADTAVDIFIYDTSKDSDGGAWRKRTTHTSWYNETLGTATRGTRREFPAVAVIVAETTQLKIYDGDNPDLPMWMVFNLSGAVGGACNMIPIGGASSQSDITSVAFLNAKLVVGLKDVSGSVGEGLAEVNFISDFGRIYREVASGFTGSIYNLPISGRNSNSSFSGDYNSLGIIAQTINDVAMTVLPNAPIDPATGLPIPTIAVGTDSGASIIKDDGRVVDIVGSSQTVGVDREIDNIYFVDNKYVAYSHKYATELNIILSSDDSAAYYNQTSGFVGRISNSTSHWSSAAVAHAIGADIETIQLKDEKSAASFSSSGLSLQSSSKLVYSNSNTDDDRSSCYITKDYNTGWQVGAIKGTFLSDTDTTNVSADTLNSVNTFDGTFASVTGWTANSDWSISGGVATCNGNNSGRFLYPTNDRWSIGSSVVVEVTVTAYTSGTLHVAYGTGAATAGTNMTATGTYRFLNNVSGNDLIYLRSESFIGSIDNVKIYYAEYDRSPNNKGLIPYGTITKSAVATGADLVAYKGTTASTDRLEQPYNSDLDFGTGDFSIMFWIRGDANPAAWQRMFERKGGENFLTIRIHPQDSGTYQGEVMFKFGSAGWAATNYSIVGKGWLCIVFTRISGTSKMYVNGVEEYSTTSHNGTVNNGSNGFMIDNNSIKLSLLRVSSSTPSPEQIKKIYEDEKVLFQENAKCTLYGSSNTVTALAFDESTDRLHVGTSSGRSDFQGLRRINNTTTAVTTAISAHDEFIIEQ